MSQPVRGSATSGTPRVTLTSCLSLIPHTCRLGKRNWHLREASILSFLSCDLGEVPIGRSGVPGETVPVGPVSAGSKGSMQLRRVSGSGRLPPSRQTVTYMRITGGFVEMQILTQWDPTGSKFLISDKLPGDMGAAGPPATLRRGLRTWDRGGREEREGRLRSGGCGVASFVREAAHPHCSRLLLSSFALVSCHWKPLIMSLS